MNNLKLDADIFGGYFSSEQIDMLSIIQCKNFNDLVTFIKYCDQINRVPDIYENLDSIDLETAKRMVFKKYQDTLVSHDSTKDESALNKFKYLGIVASDLESIIDRKHPYSEEIVTLNHHFVSRERDQLKNENLYDEMVFLESQLDNFNSIVVGSGKIYTIVNKFFRNKELEKRYDFYHVKRDLAFALRNRKQVRFHSLLVREDPNNLFEGKNKNQILEIISEYVKNTINFISEYNKNNKIIVNGKEEPQIYAIDLFNEIISFDKDKDGDYNNIWVKKYGISLKEIIETFEYAKTNKPEGVKYLYNEPFLENGDRRKKVLETISEIEVLSPGLIDTLGSQMHITIREDLNNIKNCYEDFKAFQDSTGKNVEITEFDMSLCKNDIERVFGEKPDVQPSQVYDIKKEKINEISQIINNSGVKLSGVSYWALTDGIDFNLERIRSDFLKEEKIKNSTEIPSAFGGLFSTHQNKLVSQKENIIKQEQHL